MSHRLVWDRSAPRTLEEFRQMNPSRIWFSSANVWWSAIPQPQLVHPVFGFPCDPLRAPILSTDDVEVFIAGALKNPSMYGRWGLQTFFAAHHGHVVNELGMPTCLATWPLYDALLTASREF